MQRKSKVYPLIEGALMVAVAQILSIIKLWEMPWGGSVVLAMVPIILYSVRWGLYQGLIASFAFGALQLLLDCEYAYGWQSMLGDYLVAFGALGVAGIFCGKKNGVFMGTIVGGLARFLVHYVVGATVWASYMPETFVGMQMTSPWIYSAIYNILYMGPNIIITLVVFGVFAATPLRKYLTGEDIH